MNFDDTARFFGPSNKLWPELFAPPSKRATILCADCRKVEVQGIKRYCGKCAAERQRKSHRDAMRRKRRLGVTKTENSPARAEALRTPKKQVRYDDPKTSFSPYFPTGEGVKTARGVA
jgi:hypothetical protein